MQFTPKFDEGDLKEGKEGKNEKNGESDISKINEFNNKSVDNILDDKLDVALDFLKKAESQLESIALGNTVKFDKKILIIVLHNLACCYQKLKDYDNCVSYLEAVIYHFDGLLENRHGIKIAPEYFIKAISQDQSHDPLLGDFILELRFSAKFHLQMCAVLSQANNHKDALYHAKLAALMCEDNIVKTYHLFNQMTKSKDGISQKKPNGKAKEVEDCDDPSMFEEKLKESEKIICQLYKKVMDSKKLTEKNEDGKALREREIEEFMRSEELKMSVRNILGVKKKDDWIHLLNIGNIMYLSALTYDDLDLDSDPKYELLRDAILEKIVMLTVAYFCIATEVRFLNDCTFQANIKDNGDYWHSQAVEFSCTFLPGSCPIVKHYVSSYYKHYGNNLQIIPENEIVNNKIEIIRSDVEPDKDPLIFVKLNIVTVQEKEKEKPPAPHKPLPKFKLILSTHKRESKRIENKDNTSNSNSNSIITLNNTSNNDLLFGKSFSSRNIFNKNAQSKNANNESLTRSSAKSPLTDRDRQKDKSPHPFHKIRKESLTSRNSDLTKPSLNSYSVQNTLSNQSFGKVSNSFRDRNLQAKYQVKKNDRVGVKSKSPKPEISLNGLKGVMEKDQVNISRKHDSGVPMSMGKKTVTAPRTATATAKPVKQTMFSVKANVPPKLAGIIQMKIKSNSRTKLTSANTPMQRIDLNPKIAAITPQSAQNPKYARKLEYSTFNGTGESTLGYYNKMKTDMIVAKTCLAEEENRKGNIGVRKSSRDSKSAKRK